MGLEKCLCQLRQYKEKLSSPKRLQMCPMFWRDVTTWFVVSAATWRATLQRRLTCLDRGQADNSTLCTFRRLCIELKKKQNKKKQEHQPILQQIDSTCVLCLRDTLQMTNKQNEPNDQIWPAHCRKKLKSVEKHRTSQRAGR